MKVAIVVLALVVFVQANTLNDVLKSQFKAFKEKHGKVYKDVGEELHRMKIFRSNMEIIKSHNKRFAAGEVTFEMGENQFTDMTQSEFKSLVLTKLDPNDFKPDIDHIYNPSPKARLPSSVDWRNSGVVNPVKDQINCSACWAFSAIGALESHHYIQKKQNVSLSEQNLVDCTYGYPYFNSGCGGGWPSVSYNYILNNGGINTASYYPYEDGQGICRFNRSYVGSKISNVMPIPSGNEDILALAVANEGPISVCINATYLHGYQSGVLNMPCLQGTNHCVVVDGYGTDPTGGDYWLVRNSWGPDWGENGYVRMARNQDNQCSIASFAIFPVVA